jgi:oxygen-dependent protoporphyrinogen oxidase
MLTDELSALIDALGLTATVRPAAPQAQRRFIVRDGHPLAVPMSPLAMLRSPLFSVGAKLRVLREPFISPRTDAADESVAAFVQRRLGAEPLTYAVDPFVSGVYAGDPARLSVAHAFPRLAALERTHGSLVRGMIAGARLARRARQQTGGAPRRPSIISFLDGMGTLPLALAESLGSGNVLRRARVTEIASGAGGTSLVTVERDAGTFTLPADAVVSTLPMHALAGVRLGGDTAAAIGQLASLPYPPVISLALGFRRADVAHALDGFGCLIPSVEQRTTLGVLFSSTLFANRAPEGHVLLTCFLGGTRRAELGSASTESLLAIVLPELSELLGVHGAPTLVHRTTWPHAIPQYNLGHDAHGRAADAIEALVPGLIVDGQFRQGVSVGDCVAAGERIARRALALARLRQSQAHDADAPRDAVSLERDVPAGVD